MKNILIFIAFSISIVNTAFSQSEQIVVEPKGVFKEIDVIRHNEAIEIIRGNNTKQKAIILKKIKNKPNFYNPNVLYALSNELFNQDKKEEAMYWFYLAQLRARFDANLCMDKSATQAVNVLNNTYGPNINKFAFNDLKKLKKTVTSVVSFVRKNQEDYDHRWLNLHGMWYFLAGLDDKSEIKELSQPKVNWASIKKKTVDNYYNSFTKYLSSLEK
ncbi:hypothetical protein OAX11_05050 [Flavobacteriaceae bacterium]|nr:hypothetical protein [Flavobacteriaceae bacterium]